MADFVIKVKNLSKYYKLGQYNNGTFFRDMQSRIADMRGKEDPNGKIGAKRRSELEDGFYALNDVSFEVERGSRLGIIGRNGAGKSTLLKLLSQITTPTNGEIRIRGRVASLLEVGTGFHPEMTGRENIYLNGSIMGMRRHEINRKINDIIEFSEIGEHIDTPVKRYSSGMYVRLGFAVAANLDSDILIADEVLAVGDARFQKKAIGKMNDISTGEGRTVLFVSHQMNAVKSLCTQGIVLDHGRIVRQGVIDECISFYQKDLYGSDITTDLTLYNNEFFDIYQFEIVDEVGKKVSGSVPNNEGHYVRIGFNMKKIHSAFTIGYAVYDSMGTLVYWSYDVDEYDNHKDVHIGNNLIEGEIPRHFLNEGTYSIRLMSSLHFQEWIINPERSCPQIEFSIQGGLSDSPFWSLKRPGICAPLLKWRQKE